MVALGGHALWPATPERIEQVCSALIELLDDPQRRLVLVFGNGPQVGAELLRREADVQSGEAATLDRAVAATQGTIGALLELGLRSALAKAGLARRVVGLVSAVEVDPHDPAFAAPDKPIGACHDAATAARLRVAHGWTMVEERGRGVRRVVPSPRPRALLELDALLALLDGCHVVIAGGGGGVPVVRDATRWRAVEAVIDKDHTAALIGRAIAADTMIVLTAVDAVQRGFATPHAEPLATLTRAQALALADAGEFAPGSMAPKIAAALEFLDVGTRVLITAPARLHDALSGRAGTAITR